MRFGARSHGRRAPVIAMPIYEYRCASCGHELEALQKISEAPLRECPACHRADLRKKVSAAGFQLKGSGWYVTDFRNSGAKPAKGDAAKSDTTNDGAKGDGDGTSKPADAGAKAETTSETTSTKSGGTTETKTTTVTSDKAGS
jgi:putative FmdB family regulatory protein